MITVITGGTGSIKLIRGLDSVLDEKMTIITNVGDNIKLFGLYICPDIDTTLYGLSKQLDRERGWGIKNDTFNFRDSLKNISEDIWFQIGDKDLATHVKRTKLIEKGLNLTEITKIFAKELNIKHNIIPASDDNIETTIITDNEEMHLQEFWVKNKGKPLIKDIIYKGIQKAKPSREVVRSILESDKIIIAPGNPVSSIGPTIFIKQIRDALRKSHAKKILVSPIINNRVISGPAGKMIVAKGYEVSISGLIEYYSDVITDIIIDKLDNKEEEKIKKMGKITHLADILMKNDVDETLLAKKIIGIKL